MADVLNLKIDERLNVQRPNLRGNEQKDKTSKLIYIKGQVWDSEKLRVLRNIDLTNISKICQILANWKNSE